MKIGLFSDTYFPQVSGVATSIRTLKEELEKHGHDVLIFTTTDPHVTEDDETIVRLPSIPFISFKDRRIMVRGMLEAYEIAKDKELDLIHTHTEFGVGWLGKYIGKKLHIPVVHTYHTMYEDYLHYIAKGKLLKPSHVRQATRTFCRKLSGVVCPSERVVNKLKEYNVKIPMKIVPTGINLEKFQDDSEFSLHEEMSVRDKYSITEQRVLLLSLSRLSYEKNIQTIVDGMPEIIEHIPEVLLMIVGDGPYRKTLEKMVVDLGIEKHVIFIGEVDNQEVGTYYREADYFVSASSSESQGLTFIEALASRTQVVAKENDYIKQLFSSKELGQTYEKDNEFAQTFIHYYHEQILADEQRYQEKLREISSTRFGEEILEFYDVAAKYYYLMDEIKSGTSLTHHIKTLNIRKIRLRK